MHLRQITRKMEDIEFEIENYVTGVYYANATLNQTSAMLNHAQELERQLCQ